jgi:hypothetical protein
MTRSGSELMTAQRRRLLTIIAQDPSIKVNGRILRAIVPVPFDATEPGPWGERIHVLDYDATSNTLYAPLDIGDGVNESPVDPFLDATDAELLDSPQFHQQQVYAVASRTLARFEAALGRRLPWGFNSPQLKLCPHAFAEPNAFYAREHEAVLFGYFRNAQGKAVLSSLAHDVVAHEVSHALLDGLRPGLLAPSSPDQGAFHEAFADLVAIFSVFALQEVVEAMLMLGTTKKSPRGGKQKNRLLSKEVLDPGWLRDFALLGLAKQMGQELSGIRGEALRHSATLTPTKQWRDDPDFSEPHRRGEILVACGLHTFTLLWSHRLQSLGEVQPGFLDRARVAEDGAAVADSLLTSIIRCIDYLPPVHVDFSDVLSALLTSHYELFPGEQMRPLRDIVRKAFADFGIKPASTQSSVEPGLWCGPKAHPDYREVHFSVMQYDETEAFRFLWRNRNLLALAQGAYTNVESVRPCLRRGEDGFMLRETVISFTQQIKLKASELGQLSIARPVGMPEEMPVTLFGGGTLIFDERGELKYYIHNRLLSPNRQSERLQYLWNVGAFDPGVRARSSIAAMHRDRAIDRSEFQAERW